MTRLFARKPIQQVLDGAASPDASLKRALGKWDLTALGVGAIVGAGIFASTGSAIAGGSAHIGAGPAIVLSFVFTAVTCGFAALCYAELAAMVPVAGSAYTYAYTALGELVAWIIGWDLILEYAVGNVAVAVSWSGYFLELLGQFGVHVPAWLATDYRTAFQAAELVQGNPGAGSAAVYLASAATQAPYVFGIPVIVNLPAVVIVALITALLVYGIRESARSNSLMVLLKVGIVVFFIAVGALLVKPANFVQYGGFAPNGLQGITAAAAIIFFAYIGFDAVSTAAEEARNPGRDLPFGIVASLVICTVLYILVATVMTGMAPWHQLGTAQPMLTALRLAGGDPRLLSIARFIVGLGAVVAMTSVLLVFQLGQPRIFFSMARDGLLPAWAARIHPRFRTPHVTTILTGVFVAVFSAFVNINEAVELTNIGTLFAFVLVSIGVIVLRIREPERKRHFRVPGSPLTPLIAVGACGFLMFQLPMVTWVRFGIWLVIGLVIYASYGYHRSALAHDNPQS